MNKSIHDLQFEKPNLIFIFEGYFNLLSNPKKYELMECKQEQNKSFCNCTYPCPTKGMCCDCLQSHRKTGELPACYFPEDIEKTYDRSIENFVRLYQERGAWW